MTQQPAPLTTKATVQSFSIGARHYELRMNDCGKKNCNKCGGTGVRKPSHGPYWYLCVLARGAWRRIYLGKELDTTRFIGKDGKVDWQLVKEKRILKTYQETTNKEVPGQLDFIGEPRDLALEHDALSSPRAAGDVGPDRGDLSTTNKLFAASSIVHDDLSQPPGHYNPPRARGPDSNQVPPAATPPVSGSKNQPVTPPIAENPPSTPALIAHSNKETAP